MRGSNDYSPDLAWVTREPHPSTHRAPGATESVQLLALDPPIASGRAGVIPSAMAEAQPASHHLVRNHRRSGLRHRQPAPCNDSSRTSRQRQCFAHLLARETASSASNQSKGQQPRQNIVGGNGVVIPFGIEHRTLRSRPSPQHYCGKRVTGASGKDSDSAGCPQR